MPGGKIAIGALRGDLGPMKNAMRKAKAGHPDLIPGRLETGCPGENGRIL
jgi:hypothetical protein